MLLVVSLVSKQTTCDSAGSSSLTDPEQSSEKAQISNLDSLTSSNLSLILSLQNLGFKNKKKKHNKDAAAAEDSTIHVEN